MVRATAFDKASETGGSAVIEAFGDASGASLSSFVSENLVKSDR